MLSWAHLRDNSQETFEIFEGIWFRSQTRALHALFIAIYDRYDGAENKNKLFFDYIFLHYFLNDNYFAFKLIYVEILTSK